MDYRRVMLGMMQDMARDFSPEKYRTLVSAFAEGISHAMALCANRDEMKESMKTLFTAVWQQAILQQKENVGFQSFMDKVIKDETTKDNTKKGNNG